MLKLIKRKRKEREREKQLYCVVLGSEGLT